MRRAQEMRVELAVDVDVVGEAALAAQERIVLDARDGSAAAEAGVFGRCAHAGTPAKSVGAINGNRSASRA
jgi:hypothetical protein